MMDQFRIHADLPEGFQQVDQVFRTKREADEFREEMADRAEQEAGMPSLYRDAFAAVAAGTVEVRHISDWEPA